MPETLDIEDPSQLRDYLRSEGLAHASERIWTQVLAGGVSNRTVLVKFGDGRELVFKQALSKLRVRVDWESDPARVHREALAARWLKRVVPSGRTPDFAFEDFDQHLFAMAAVPQPHANWKTQLLAGTVRVECVAQFGELLAAIHRNAHALRHELPQAFQDRRYFEELRLEPYYGYAATRVPDASEYLLELMSETRNRHDTLVHGDYSPKNILVYKGGIVLLDHEVMHIGDPAFDLGFALTHLLSKAHHVRSHRHTFLEAAGIFWQSYEDSLGERSREWSVEPRAVRHTIACLLARVAGRSPLEYLEPSERRAQQDLSLQLMASMPSDISDLIGRFHGGLR